MQATYPGSTNASERREETKGSEADTASATGFVNTYTDKHSIDYFKSSKFLASNSVNLMVFSESCCMFEKYFGRG